MNTKAFKKSVLLFFCLLSLSCLSVRSQQVIVGSNNLIETYRVSWWNMPISFGLSGNWARAMVGVIDIDNGELALRHTLMEGRPLKDYSLPYWPYQYRPLLQTMIRDWRSRFGLGDFGFHIVSLANYKQVSETPRESDWAELREAQAMAAKALPNCGIAMAIDIGDADDIHPRNKKEVGRRLALSALAITYGENIEWSGPWYKSMEIDGKGIRLTFDHAQNGFIVKGDKLSGFAIAGEDRNFVWADAVTDGTSILVSSPEVPKPLAVRYGWDANPECNLYNEANLPAVPFRTDNWTTN